MQAQPTFTRAQSAKRIRPRGPIVTLDSPFCYIRGGEAFRAIAESILARESARKPEPTYSPLDYLLFRFARYIGGNL